MPKTTKTVTEKPIDKSGWYLDKHKKNNVCQDAAAIFQNMSAIIQKEFIDQLNLPPETKIAIGPCSTSYRGTQNHNVLFSITINNTIEVSYYNNSNTHLFNQDTKLEQGFTISGIYENYTKQGIIGYINQIWVPDQKKKLARVKKRKEAQGELTKDVIDLSHMQFDHYHIPPALNGWINKRRTGRTIPKESLKYYLIADDKTLKTIKTLKSKYTPYEKNSYYNRNKEKPKHFEWLIIVTRSDRNMAKIISLSVKESTSSGYFSYWNAVHESNWFSPKNTMKMLEKYVSERPALTSLLYDTGTK